MKKTIKIVAILALILFFVTGCSMKENISLEISKDKTVKAKVIAAMDDEMIDYYISMSNGDEEEATYTDAERWEFVESSSEESEDYEGYSKEKYDQDGYKGYVYTLELGKIDDLLATDSDTVGVDELTKGAKIFTKKGDTYSLNINKGSEDEIEQAKSYKEYGAAFDLKFSVTLPNKAISNNATTVSKDGKTYTWDLLEAQDIQLSFDLNGNGGSSSNVLPIVLGIVAGVAIIAVVVVVVVKVSKKGKTENKEN